MSDTERLVFQATLTEDGKIQPQSVHVTRARLAKWAGRKVLVTVTKFVKPKTLPQLGYFHGVMLPIFSDHCGYDLDEMKVELKRAFLARRRVVSRLTGEEVEEIPSLADLNSEEMSTFIERLIREGAQMGLYIPPANSDWTYPEVAI